jgi:hypothetical protein
MPTRIFITGKVERANPSQLKEFELAKAQLIDEGFIDVRTAADDMVDFQEEMDFATRSQYFNKRGLNLFRSTVVLYLENWNEDPKAVQEIREAHAAKKLTTSVVLFLKNHSKYVPA